MGQNQNLVKKKIKPVINVITAFEVVQPDDYYIRA